MRFHEERLTKLRAQKAHHVQRLRAHLSSRHRDRRYPHVEVARREISSIRIINARMAPLIRHDVISQTLMLGFSLASAISEMAAASDVEIDELEAGFAALAEDRERAERLCTHTRKVHSGLSDDERATWHFEAVRICIEDLPEMPNAPVLIDEYPVSIDPRSKPN
jgi:hypothetical protein